MEDKKSLILKAIEKYYAEGDFSKINVLTLDVHPNIFYDYFQKRKFNKKDYIAFLENLNAPFVSKFFENFSTNQQLEFLVYLSDGTVKKIFSGFYVDEIVDILEEYSYEKIRYIINLLDEDLAKKVTDIFKYKKYQIGFHMVIDFISINENLTIKEAKADIKKKVSKDFLEIIGNIFVVNDKDKLVGYITPDRIIVEDNNKKVKTFLIPIDYLLPTDKIPRAEKILAKFDVPSVPVVDENQKIIGVIEAEDVIEMYDEIDEAFFEPSTASNHDVKTYFDFSSFDIFKSRFTWIFILLFVGTLSQIIIMEFQNIWATAGIYGGTASDVVVSQIVTLALATALSVSSSINDSAGNSGSQTSATLIRGIATGEIEEKDFGKAILKEVNAAIYLGAVISFASLFRVFLVWWIVGELNDISSIALEIGWTVAKVWFWYLIIALISSFTFFVAIVIGNFIGALLPIIAYKFNSDGTIMSGPLQTTLVDIFVITVYLGLTTAVFVPLANSHYFDVGDFATKANFESINFASNYSIFNL